MAYAWEPIAADIAGDGDRTASGSGPGRAVTRLREIEGREHGQADDRGPPRDTADLPDYPLQGAPEVSDGAASASR